ncbi:MAG: hypothetical protein GY853_13480 [PVC group bacterium]|nr:hypothetical protein [PVC group bacterium]
MDKGAKLLIVILCLYFCGCASSVIGRLGPNTEVTVATSDIVITGNGKDALKPTITFNPAADTVAGSMSIDVEGAYNVQSSGNMWQSKTVGRSKSLNGVFVGNYTIRNGEPDHTIHFNYTEGGGLFDDFFGGWQLDQNQVLVPETDNCTK